MVTITINGKKLKAQEEDTILTVARRNGIYIRGSFVRVPDKLGP